MSKSKVVITIDGNASPYLSTLKEVDRATADFERSLGKIAKISGAAFAALTVGAGVAIKTFADFQEGLIGVGKTTNIQGKALEKFGKEIQKLSEVLPVSQAKLLDIATAAGQLGISASKDLLKFTDTIAKLGTAANISGGEAATALARILGITGESIQNIDRLASSIVFLGNNFKASESEIVSVATRLVQATAQFGTTSAEVVGLAATLRSLGVQSELAGSVVGRTFLEIENSINAGGQSIENLSKITGIAVEDLKKQFGEDATGVFEQFIIGLDEAKKNGQSVTDVLKQFGLEGIRIQAVLPVLAKNVDLLSKGLRESGEEFERNTALQKEFAAANASLNSQIQRTKNSFNTLLTIIGGDLAPQFAKMLTSLDSAIDSFNSLDRETQILIASTIAFATAFTGVVTAMALTALAASKLRKVFIALRATILATGGAMRVFRGILTFGISVVITDIIVNTDKWIERLNFLKATIAALGIGIAKTFNNIKRPILEVRASMLEFGVTVFTQINKMIMAFDSLASAIPGIERPLQGLTDSITDGLDENIRLIKELRDEASGIAEVNENLDTVLDDYLLGLGKSIEQTRQLGREADETAQALSEIDKLNLEANAEAAARDAGTGGGERDINGLAKSQSNERIQIARDEIAALRLLKEGAGEEEVELLRQKLAVERELKEAENIKDDELRAVELEKLVLQQEIILENIEEFDERKRELEAELREIADELQIEIDEEELAELQKQLQSKADLEKKFRLERITEAAKERELFKKEEIKFGKAIATLKQAARLTELGSVAQAAKDFLAIEGNRSKALEVIIKGDFLAAKAAAIADTLVKTQQAIATALASTGPPANFALAALAGAAGAITTATVASTAIQGIGAQDGALVGGSGSGDTQGPFMLEPGELITPRRNFDEVIESVASQRGMEEADDGDGEGGSGGGQNVNVEISFTEDAAQILTARQRADATLGIAE